MAAKSIEDYWNTSSSTSFNFDDDNELDKSFASSMEGFDTQTDSVFGSNLDDSSSQIMLPMHSIMTKRNLDSVLDDVRVPYQTPVPSVQETMIKMFLGMPYVLYKYRSLDQKLELLDEAVATEDGNIILAVLLDLKRSLKLSILLHHLSKRKVALQHYCNYLMQESKLEELAIVYMVTGNYTDIVYLFYLGCKHTCSKASLHIKLLQFLSDYQAKLDNDKNLIFVEYKKFIKWQMENYFECDSVIEQLAVLYKTEAEKTDGFKQIANFKQNFKISDFQYEWIQLNTLGALGMWKKLMELFIKPTWLTKKNLLKSVIDSELFVSTLNKHHPPKQVVEDLLVFVPDHQVSLALAKKMGCHKFVVDMYITQRDRQAILLYRDNITSQSEEFFYLENALRSTDIKWRN